MKAFEIFKPGKVTDSAGVQHDFTEEMLAGAAAAYDPALHEAPICVGHPANDAPAYGWVSALAFEEGRLVAAPAEVEPQFAEMVKAGRFKKRSASFYPPDHKSNPKPGSWYLKHCAFLGATPPAVKGLKDVAFEGGDEGTVVVEFGETERTIGWAFRNLAEIGRRFRERIIDKDGLEEADKVIPEYLISSLADNAARIAVKNEPSFSEPNPEDNVKLTEEQLSARAAELDARDAELKARETANATKEASFSETEKKTRRTGHALALDALIAAGKFAPALKAEALDFLDGLDGTTAVEFGEGEAKAKATPAEWFLGLLQKSGTIVNFSEISGEEGGNDRVVEFSAPEGASVDPERMKLHQKALDYQSTHQGVDYMTAVHAVGGR